MGWAPSQQSLLSVQIFFFITNDKRLALLLMSLCLCFCGWRSVEWTADWCEQNATICTFTSSRRLLSSNPTLVTKYITVKTVCDSCCKVYIFLCIYGTAITRQKWAANWRSATAPVGMQPTHSLYCVGRWGRMANVVDRWCSVVHILK